MRRGERIVKGKAIVLVGHGSRVAGANEEFLRFAELLHESAGLPVEPGFVDLAEPTLPDALQRPAVTASEVAVLPFVRFAARHVKSDIPLQLQVACSRCPQGRFAEGAPIGLHPRILEILDDRVGEAQRTVRPRPDAETALLLVGRGSSDPDANSDLVKLGRLFWEGRAFSGVEAAFCGVTRPLVPEALRRL